MRGIVSEKLLPFLSATNAAILAARQAGQNYSPEQLRSNLDMLTPLLPAPVELARVVERSLTVAGHTILARVYSPAPEQALPVVLHLHGGGHMCGSVELYDPISRKIAVAGHCVVIAIEYRLAPEHPYPAGLQDCQAALEHYEELLDGIEHRKQLILLGDSAGGALCTTLARDNLASDSVKIDKQILIYPSVDYSMSCASVQQNGEGFMLEQDRIRWYFQQYFQQQYQDNNVLQRASPLFGPFSAQHPDTLIITAGCDPLRDEGIAYGNALIQAGARVQQQQFDGMIHAFMLLHALVAEECAQSYQLIGDFIRC